MREVSMKQSNVVRQWDMFIQGNRSPQVDRKERSLLCSVCYERNLSANYFTVISLRANGFLFRRFRREKERSKGREKENGFRRVFYRSIGRWRRIGDWKKKYTEQNAEKERGGSQRLLPSRELLLDRDVERPRWLVRITWQLEIWYRIR